MEYAISRTSKWNNEKPCDEAYSKTYTVFLKHWDKPREDTKWFVEVDDLNDFVKKYSPLVLDEDDSFFDGQEPISGSGLSLEIYDDYRE